MESKQIIIDANQCYNVYDRKEMTLVKIVYVCPKLIATWFKVYTRCSSVETFDEIVVRVISMIRNDRFHLVESESCSGNFIPQTFHLQSKYCNADFVSRARKIQSVITTFIITA